MEPTMFTARLRSGNLAVALVLLAALVGLYYPVLTYLVHDWSTNDNYSHGFFIPLISGYMVYALREELGRIAVRPANWGFIVLLAGLGQLYVARVGSEYFLQRTSLIIVLLGMVLFL